MRPMSESIGFRAWFFSGDFRQPFVVVALEGLEVCRLVRRYFEPENR